MNSKNALIIMTKNPEIGKCKTRLAKTLGDQKALEIYIQLIDYTAGISKEVNADKFIYSTDILTDSKRWESPNTFFSIQSGGDLGNRMNNAITNVINQGYEKAIVLGSDCAEINADDIENAFNNLQKDDVVVGPALDGGYYLIGMKKTTPALFENISWSTETVFDDTISIAKNLNLKVSILDKKSDIDFEEDLIREGYIDFQLTINN